MSRIDIKPLYKGDVERMMSQFLLNGDIRVARAVDAWKPKVDLSAFARKEAIDRVYNELSRWGASKIAPLPDTISDDEVQAWAEVYLDLEKRELPGEMFKAVDHHVSKARRVVTGSEAVMEILCKLWDFSLDVGVATDRSWETQVAKAAVQLSALGKNMHPAVVHATLMKHPMVSTGSLFAKIAKLEEFSDAMDLLHSQTSSALIARDTAVSYALESGRSFRSEAMRKHMEIFKTMPVEEKFQIRHSSFLRTIRSGKVYSIAGLIYWVIEETLFVMTRDHLHLLRDRTRATWMFGLSSCNNRDNDVCKQFFVALSYMTTLARKHPYDVAKHLHVSYYMLLLDLAGADPEALRVKATERVNARSYEFFKGLSNNLRQSIDLSKIYHLIPTMDIDLDQLWGRTIDDLSTENGFSESTLQEFLRFCMAHDFCRFVVKHKQVPLFAKEDGYDFEESRWFKKCMKGDFSMPPIAEWGKIKISKQFRYIEHANDWQIEADDVTWVSMQKDDLFKADPLQASEILHAAFGDGETSLGRSISEARRDFFSPNFNKPVYLVVAGKAENTKSGRSVRPTYSASDEFREIFSEIEKNMEPLMRCIPAISLGAPPEKIEKQFRLMSRLTDKSTGRKSAFISGDISGWSNKYPRRVFYEHLKLCLSYTDRPESENIIRAWDRIHLVMNKREKLKIQHMPTANFQGFPGRHDSILHAQLAVYWIIKARSEGKLPNDIRIWNLVLIDDMVAAITSKKDLPDDTLATIKQYSSDVYRALGFEMDHVKTILSFDTFIYLNRVFCDNSEVYTCMKTFAKIGPEYTRILTNVFEKVDSIAGVSRAAIINGNDPKFTYCTYLLIALKQIKRVCNEVREIRAAQAAVYALCPRSEGGWGLVDCHSLCCSENRDKTSEFNHMIWQFLQVINSDDIKIAFVKIKTQPYKRISARAALRNPFQTVREEVEDPGVVRAAKVSSAILKRGPNKFYRAMLDDSFTDQLEEIYEAIGKTHKLDGPAIAEICANMPDALIESIRSKIERSEVCLKFMTRREIGGAFGMIRMIEREQIMQVHIRSTPDLSKVRDLVAAFSTEAVSPYTVAERQAFWAANGYSFANCVYPAATSSFVHVETKDTSEDRIRVRMSQSELKPVKGTAEATYFDCKTDNMAYTGTVVAGAAIYEGVSGRGLSKVDTMVQRGCRVLELLKSRGLPVGAVESFFLDSWGYSVPSRDIARGAVRFLGSLKRLPSAPGSRYHYISCYKNATASAQINFREAVLILRGTHTMIDLLSTAIAMRTTALLENHYRNEDIAWDYGIDPENLIEYEDVGFDCPTVYPAYEGKSYIDICEDKVVTLLANPATREIAISAYEQAGIEAVNRILEADLDQLELLEYKSLPSRIDLGRLDDSWLEDPDTTVFQSAGVRPSVNRKLEQQARDFNAQRQAQRIIDDLSSKTSSELVKTQLRAFLFSSIQQNARVDQASHAIVSKRSHEDPAEYMAACTRLTSIPKEAVIDVVKNFGPANSAAALTEMGFSRSIGNVSAEQVVSYLFMRFNRVRLVKMWVASPYNSLQIGTRAYAAANAAPIVVGTRQTELAKVSYLRNKYAAESARYLLKAREASAEAARKLDPVEHKAVTLYSRLCQVKGRIISSIKFTRANTIDWEGTFYDLHASASSAIIAHLKKTRRAFRRTPPEFQISPTGDHQADAEAVALGISNYYSLDPETQAILVDALQSVVKFYAEDFERTFVSLRDVALDVDEVDIEELQSQLDELRSTQANESMAEHKEEPKDQTPTPLYALLGQGQVELAAKADDDPSVTLAKKYIFSGKQAQTIDQIEQVILPASFDPEEWEVELAMSEVYEIRLREEDIVTFQQ